MPESSGFRIEHVSLSDLREWPGNPKLHDFDAIDRSIERFGFVQPLLIDERSGKMVAGHGRLATLMQMRDAGRPAPARIELRDGEWYVPVIRGIAFNSEAEAQAYLLADNRLVEKGGWDDEKLTTMLRELTEASVEVPGWSADELMPYVEDPTLGNAMDLAPDAPPPVGSHLIGQRVCPKCGHKF